jgi:hypothetical protein
VTPDDMGTVTVKVEVDEKRPPVVGYVVIAALLGLAFFIGYALGHPRRGDLGMKRVRIEEFEKAEKWIVGPRGDVAVISTRAEA